MGNLSSAGGETGTRSESQVKILTMTHLFFHCFLCYRWKLYFLQAHHAILFLYYRPTHNFIFLSVELSTKYVMEVRIYFTQWK